MVRTQAWMWLAGLLVAGTAWATELVPAELPADGEQRALLKVDSFGRYAVQVHSEQGAAVRVDDRMAGPGPLSGRAGGADGRVDTYLEAGEYRVVTQAVSGGEGRVRVEVHPFEQRGSTMELREGNVHRTQLRDYERRVYWVEVGEGGRVDLEVVGRFVGDLRLWRDGDWLEDVEPRCSSYEPKPGQPWRRCVLTATVEKGWVQAVVYGGPSLPWAEEEPVEDMVLRSGLGSVPTTARTRGVLGPEGFARVRVTGKLASARLELPEPGRAELAIESGNVSSGAGRTGQITPESRVPEVVVTGTSTASVVSVVGPPGQRYELYTYAVSDSLPYSGSVDLRTIPQARVVDVLEPTGLLWHYDGDGHAEVVAAQALELNRGDYERRFNLLSSATMLLRVERAGTWSVALTEGEGTVHIEPFWVSPPPDYRSPPPSPGGVVKTLDPGLYVLTLQPTTPGVVSLRVEEEGRAGRRGERQSLPPGLRLQGVVLPRGTQLRTFGPSDVRATTVVGTGPTPHDAAPWPIAAGESLTVEVRVQAAGILEARLDGVGGLRLGVDGPTMVDRQWVDAGVHRVTVEGSSASAGLASLHLIQPNDPVGTPPSVRHSPPRGAVRDIPRLQAGSFTPLHLGSGEHVAYQLEVPRAGLYRLETTGLLATSLSMRSRTRLRLASDSGSGTGRNGAVDIYLREGSYRVDVQTRGRSAGDLTLSLEDAPMADGGLLSDGVAGRVSLDAGEGAELRFHPEQPGNYTIRALGVGSAARCRIEEEDGWALAPIVDRCDARWTLRNVGYRVIVLPTDVAARRVVSFESVSSTAAVEPGPLRFDEEVSGRWMEPQDGEERRPQVWSFALAAEATSTVEVSGEVVARLVDGDGVAHGVALDGVPLTQRLPAGSYRVEVVGERRSSRVPYRVVVRTEELVVGGAHRVFTPGSLPVSLPGGAVAVETEGPVDARLVLRDSSGAVVAQNDDRPDDWNALIAGDFPAGRYTLDVLADGRGGAVKVSLASLSDRLGAPLGAGERRAVPLGERQIAVIPLGDLVEDRVVRVQTRSDENVGLILERQGEAGWEAVAEGSGRRAEVALRTDGAGYRVRLWSLDQRGLPAMIRATHSRPVASAQRVAVSGGAARVRGADAGLWTFEAPSDGLWWCPRPGACLPARPGTFPAPDGGLWFAGEGRVTVREAVLDEPVVVDWRTSEAGEAALARGEGALVVTSRTDAGVVRVDLEGEEHFYDALAGGSAAVDLSGRSTVARLVEASPGATRVKLEQVRLAEGAPLSTSLGSTDAVLPAMTWRAVQALPAEDEVRVVLPPGALAQVRGARGVELLWAADGGRVERLAAPVHELMLLNPTAEAAPFVVERWRGGEPPVVADPGAPVRLRFDQRGVERVRLAGPPDARLDLSGAIEGAWILRPDGGVDLGPDLFVDGGGVLVLEHGVGPALIAQDAPTARTADAVVVSRGQAVELTRDHHRLQVREPAGVLARVAVSEAVVAEVRVGDGVPRREVRGDGVVIAWLPAGAGEVLLSAEGGGSMRSVARVELLTPAPAQSGLGDAFLLPPGGTRAIRLDLDEARDVGLGVRASSDVVQGRLYGPDGDLIGRGLVQNHHLEAGTYVFAISAPADGPALRVQAAVVGLDSPGDGPPPEVVQTYLEEN